MFHRFLMPALLSVCLAPAALAQQAEDSHAADRAQLRNMAAQYEKATNAGDIEGMCAMLAPDFTGTTVTGGILNSPDDLRVWWKKIQGLAPGGHHQTKIHFTPALFGGDLVVAHGTTDDVFTDGSGRTFEWQAPWTAVLRKKGGTFEVVRLQTTMDPIENPFVASVAKIMMRTTALIAGVLAGMIGCGIGYWLGRRKRVTKVNPA